MYNLGDRVSVRIRDHINEVDNYYPAIIVDIEECHEYDAETMRRRGIYLKENPIVKTGRFGVHFQGVNPTLIYTPYFWEKDFISEK